MREFFIGEGRDQPLHHLDDFRGATEWDGVRERRVFGIGPDFDGDRVAAVDHGAMLADREFTGADDHRIRRNWCYLVPLAEPACVRTASPASLVGSRGDHAPTIWHNHVELDAGLVTRVINGRKPVPSAFGPIVCKRAALPARVRADEETVPWESVVEDDYVFLVRVLRIRQPADQHLEQPAVVRKTEQVPAP